MKRKLIEKRRKEVSAVDLVAEECIAVRLRLLTRAVTRLYNGALRPYGLTVSQMNILVAVRRMGEARPQAICHVLQLEKSTLSRDVERMVARGWLQSTPGPDARTIHLNVTPAGEKLVEKTIPAWKNAQRQAKALLRKQGIMSLQKAVATIRSTESPITA